VQVNVILIVLLGLAVVIASYAVAVSWRVHLVRQQGAATRQWRYRSSLIKSLFKSVFVMAGTSPSGVVWEVRQVRRNGRSYLHWSTHHSRLPYGLIRITPRRAAIAQVGEPHIRLTTWHNETWSNPSLVDYAILTSHQQLGDRFLTQEIALTLMHWPEWPLPGALEEVLWSRDHLDVQVRYFSDWATLDRTVALGVSFAESLTHHRP
jgi:hypothetical protein